MKAKFVKYLWYNGKTLIVVPKGSFAVVSAKKVKINGRLQHEFKKWWMGKPLLPDTIIVRGAWG